MSKIGDSVSKKKEEAKAEMNSQVVNNSEFIPPQLMELKISSMHLVVNFGEGDLKGLTVSFHGEWCSDNMFGVYTRSAKAIEPLERKLTDEELEYVKASVLAYCESPNTKRKVKFSLNG